MKTKKFSYFSRQLDNAPSFAAGTQSKPSDVRCEVLKRTLTVSNNDGKETCMEYLQVVAYTFSGGMAYMISERLNAGVPIEERLP